MNQYIRLFEEFEQDLQKQTGESSHTWSEIRDILQEKLPFILIVFSDKSSYIDALDDELLGQDPIKQDAYFSANGKLLKYPSIFVKMQEDKEAGDLAQKLYSKFNIRQLIIGEKGEDQVRVYFDDGSDSSYGNEVVSGLSLEEMDNDDHFKLGSTYYKFISFEG